MNENIKTITIDGALYRELRDYCDANGIRLIDFIEDSLETATYRREMEALLTDAERLRGRIALITTAAVRQGFTQGVMAASLAMAGHIGASQKVTPDAAKSGVDFRPIKGEQLPLFGDL